MRPTWCRKSRTGPSISTAPCAGVTPTRWGRSNSGTRWGSSRRRAASNPKAGRCRATSNECCAAGATGFYRAADAEGQPRTQYFDFAGSEAYVPIKPRPGVIALADLKRARGVVKKNPGASLIDLGDGVLCCEFHSKMNTLGEDVFLMLQAGLTELETNFDAMVIGNQGENFCVGRQPDAGAAGRAGRRMGRTGVDGSPFPAAQYVAEICAETRNRCAFWHGAGGGCEVPLHCARVQASAEIVYGSGGGGRWADSGGRRVQGDAVRVRMTSKKAVRADRICQGLRRARPKPGRLGYLRGSDGISMNPERLIDDAKQAALALVPGYAPGAPRQDIAVSGEEGYALMKMGVWMAREGGYISDYDAVIGEKLAGVLSGGRLKGNATGFRTTSARSGTGSVPEPVWTPGDPGAHPAHAEDRKTASKLNLLCGGIGGIFWPCTCIYEAVMDQRHIIALVSEGSDLGLLKAAAREFGLQVSAANSPHEAAAAHTNDRVAAALLERPVSAREFPGPKPCGASGSRSPAFASSPATASGSRSTGASCTTWALSTPFACHGRNGSAAEPWVHLGSGRANGGAETHRNPAMADRAASYRRPFICRRIVVRCSNYLERGNPATRTLRSRNRLQQRY